eukprot:4103653-Prymnesium_polylepis.2
MAAPAALAPHVAPLPANAVVAVLASEAMAQVAEAAAGAPLACFSPRGSRSPMSAFSVLAGREYNLSPTTSSGLVAAPMLASPPWLRVRRDLPEL